jgi:hypothetical protein
MNLRERLDNPDRRTEPLTPIVERRGGTERRIPEWVKRAQEKRLPNSDRTGQVAA